MNIISDKNDGLPGAEDSPPRPGEIDPRVKSDLGADPRGGGNASGGGESGGMNADGEGALAGMGADGDEDDGPVVGGMGSDAAPH